VEYFAPAITALSTTLAIMSVLWIYRRTGRADSVHFVFSVGVVIYALFHFYACGVLGIVNPLHGVISGLFVASVAIVNSYCSTCNTSANSINIGMDRRHQNKPVAAERRENSEIHIFPKKISN
jgi:hypothetical protein